MPDPFVVKDCDLLAIATGRRAHNLRELYDRLEQADPACVYYHFWGGLLRPHFDDPQFPNDFAAWASHGLHDQVLAERLGIVNPANFGSLEDLRCEVLEVIEERLDETETVPWAPRDDQFHFIHSKIVVVDTGRRIEDPKQLKKLVPQLTRGGVFYHFIDARRRLEDGQDDFSAWLAGFGDEYLAVIDGLGTVDPYFNSLTETRDRIAAVLTEHL